jgi:tripartite ATP-independent transporter DctM subunit
MGAISFPEMKKYRYDDSLATGSIAAGGVLGALIPPSVVFIVYGMATEQSIGRLFISGIIPGIMLMFLYIGAIVALTVKNPALGPKGPKAGWIERLSTLNKGLWETLLIFFLSMSGLIFGWFTPTEAGAVGVGGVLLASLFRKRMSWKKLISSIIDTTRTSVMILLLIAGANIFGKFMAISRIPSGLASWTAALPFPPFAVMGIIISIYFILGLFIDALALVLLTVPIFYPVVVGILGFDPIWFGVIMVLVVGMGVMTPPVGIHVFIIKGIAKDVPLETIYKGIWPFIACILITITILIIFPAITNFLPNLLIK